MNKKLLNLLIAPLLFFGSCANDPLPAPEKIVQLKGAIGVTTRSVIGSGHNKELKVYFCRQDEPGDGRAGEYGGWDLCEAVRSGGEGSRPIIFAKPQLYPEDGRKIRLRGYYPREGSYSDEASGTVKFAVDGRMDIMVTNLLEGHNRQPVSFCTFRHLQAQVLFVCYSDRASDWGDIRQVGIEGVPAVWRLALTEEVAALSADATVREKRDIPVSGIAALPMPEVVSNGKKPQAQGYILLPVDADQTSFDVCVTTSRNGVGGNMERDHRATVQVPEGLKPGMIHQVELYFTGSRLTVTSVKVSPWNEENVNGEIPVYDK